MTMFAAMADSFHAAQTMPSDVIGYVIPAGKLAGLAFLAYAMFNRARG